MKKAISILFMLLLLCSCDAWYSYHYTINNQTSDTLKVFVSYLPPYYIALDSIGTANTKDSIYIINPHSVLTIEQEGTLCGWAYEPIDLRNQSMEERRHNGGDVLLLDYITKVYAGNKLINKKYWNMDCWNFKSKKLLGTYSITIKSDEISE